MTAFDQNHRRTLLRSLAAEYVDVAIESATREYPHFPNFIATGPESYRTHREYHPAFYGSFDWHSCVEMHWVVARLARMFPDAVPQTRIREFFDALLTVENLQREREFFLFPANKSLERPYGWGWLLRLTQELRDWNDPDSERWNNAVEPLSRLLMANLLEWLPNLTYPQRVGNHPNTAFSLSNALELAVPAEREHIESAAHRFFFNDLDYPAHYEPSGADFLSAGLCEAELMAKVLSPDEFTKWFDTFLPDIASHQPSPLFEPVIVTDASDGQIAHLHGLNLSRAWCFVRLASMLPSGDPRVEIMLEAAARHADASLPYVTGSSYMIEHWLAVYATLMLSE